MTGSRERPIHRPTEVEEIALTYGDPVMEPVSKAVQRAATTAAPVIVIGEMGCGKKLVARKVHAVSGRPGECLTFNCRRGGDGGLSEEFAFALERAREGTLILDGIDELPFQPQSELTQAVEESGTRGPRLIASTRVEPTELLESGRLRDELFLQLAVFPIRVPPIRERRKDLPALARALLTELARRWRRPTLGIDDGALSVLLEAHWPGNVRELRYVLERAAARVDDGSLRAQDLELGTYPGRRVRRSLNDIEREAIVRALADVGGNRRRAAASLGIGVRTLYDKIKRYGLGAA